jgi:hypothetical protein
VGVGIIAEPVVQENCRKSRVITVEKGERKGRKRRIKRRINENKKSGILSAF